MKAVFASEGFKEMIGEAVRCVQQKTPPADFAGMLGALMASDPAGGMIFYVLRSRTIEQLCQEAALPAEAKTVLLSPEGKAFYVEVLRLLSEPQPEEKE